MPRLVYRSLSDGSWRVTPGTDHWNFSKGIGIHYTQETKLDPLITEALEIRPVSKRLTGKEEKELLDSFNLFGLAIFQLSNPEKGIYTFSEEAQRFDDGGILEGFQRCPPGTCFTSMQWKNVSELIDSLNREGRENSLIRQFMPVFEKGPVHQYSLSHSLLSEKDPSGALRKDVRVEVFEGQLKDRTVEWHFAKDREGRVWIDRIRLQEVPLTSYGTDKEIIDSGILTNKPLEYRAQVQSLKPEAYRDFDSVYRDITPLLRKLLPIEEYLKYDSN